MDEQNKYFFEREGCPFCAQQSKNIISRVRYHETAESNKEIPDMEGKLYECEDCGIAYASHGAKVEAFPLFYKKSLDDLGYLDESILQLCRKSYMKAILKDGYKPFSVSRFLDALSLRVFQVPLLTREAKGLKMLDVGCGFGEFVSIYQELGNDVWGTEIVLQLVERLKNRGLSCLFGQLEDIPFNGMRFDVVLSRAVFYRTVNPVKTMLRFKELLFPGGEIALVDPYPGVNGAEYFFKKQFPQGHFYILNHEKYFHVLREQFNMECVASRLIYGRPRSPLNKARFAGFVIGLFKLLYANVLKRTPYVLIYTLKQAS